MPTNRTKPKVSASACHRLTGVFRLSIASCLATAAVAIPSVTYAQTAATGVVSGRVANSATGAYLENAQVRIAGTDRILITQPGGNFSFTGVPVGEVTIVASYTGLDNMEQKATVTAGATTTLDFNLTTSEYGEVMQLGEFVVSSAREGNAKAIVDQKQAANIKTSIASDAFGSVSEDNVGEFLKYMSGLTIDYVENDARQVRVRGLSAKYASVTIDGNPVASADFGIATGRSFQFEQVSLSTVDTIELNKTPLADQAASSLAGTINVRSKSALNQKGRQIKYSASLTANEYATSFSKTMGWDNQEHYKVLPNANVEFSDTFLNGKLGVVASINHTGTYVEQKIIANLARNFNNNPNDNDTEVPTITQVNWQDGLKPTFRDSVLLNLDYKVSPDLILSYRTSYNMYDAPFHNRNWTFGASAANQTNLTASSVNTIAPTATDTGASVTIAGTNFRKYGATYTSNPAVMWKINQTVTLDASLAYSKSYQWYDSDAEGFFNIVNARMNGVSWGYTSDSGEPNLNLRQLAARTAGGNDTRSFFDLANYNSNTTAQTADRNAKDQSYSGRIDVTVKLPDFVVPTTLKFGGDSRLLVKDIDNWTKVWTMDVSNGPAGINLNNYRDPYTPKPDKGETITDVNGVVGAPPSLDKWKLYDLFSGTNTNPLMPLAQGIQPFYLTTAQAANNYRNLLQNQWDLEETITSAYVLANMKVSPKLQTVVGLRFEKTETQGRAYDDIGGPRAVALSGTTDTNNFNYIKARYGSRRNKEQSYDDLFPSAQVRYSATENLIARGAYYRSILRPDVQNVAASLIVNDTETSFQTANPDLKPEYADNFDVRLEYYFEPVGVISAGAFYKQLKDVQYTTTTDFLNVADVPQDIIDAGFDPATLVANTADYRRTENGPKTTVWGFEADYSQQLSFLPGAFSGLGVFANYTFTELEEPFYSLGGSGTAKHSGNTGFTYRAKRFNAQLKFNWVGERTLAMPGYTSNATTGEVLLGTGANAGIIQYEAERLQIDLSLDYKIHRHATIFFNAANLTDSPSVRYSVHDANLIRHGAFGAKFTLGVKGSF
jgi:iron complex outermembrane receptor protein